MFHIDEFLDKYKKQIAIGSAAAAGLALLIAGGVTIAGNASLNRSASYYEVGDGTYSDVLLGDELLPGKTVNAQSIPLAGMAMRLERYETGQGISDSPENPQGGAEITPTVVVTSTPAPTATPVPTDTPAPSPSPTATPTPSPSPTPTPDPKSTVLNNYSNLGVVSQVNNYLNVRDAASTDGQIIGKVLKNSGVEILEDCGNGWYRIQFVYSETGYGYVASEFVLTGEEAKQIAIDHAMQMINVNTERLNVRVEPSTECDVLTQISTNEKYQVTNVLDGWVEISLGTNEDGTEAQAYVSADYVTLGYYLPGPIEYKEPEPTINPLRTELVNFAMQYLGGAYVWGGTTLGVGVDCSGFTQQVFANYGITLNRCSYDQAKQGVEITADQLQPGDLVFYSRPGYTIGHVAIYIGNGQVIHAYNASQGIIITSYDYATPIKMVNMIGE